MRESEFTVAFQRHQERGHPNCIPMYAQEHAHRHFVDKRISIEDVFSTHELSQNVCRVQSFSNGLKCIQFVGVQHHGLSVGSFEFSARPLEPGWRD